MRYTVTATLQSLVSNSDPVDQRQATGTTVAGAMVAITQLLQDAEGGSTLYRVTDIHVSVGLEPCGDGGEHYAHDNCPGYRI